MTLFTSIAFHRTAPCCAAFLISPLTPCGFSSDSSSFRHLTGRTGIVRMSEVIRAHGIAPKSAIINELFEAGVMGQRDDGIVVYHPAILVMMMPDLPSLSDDHWQQNNVVTLPVGNGKEGHDQSVA